MSQTKNSSRRPLRSKLGALALMVAGAGIWEIGTVGYNALTKAEEETINPYQEVSLVDLISNPATYNEELVSVSGKVDGYKNASILTISSFGLTDNGRSVSVEIGSPNTYESLRVIGAAIRTAFDESEEIDVRGLFNHNYGNQTISLHSLGNESVDTDPIKLVPKVLGN